MTTWELVDHDEGVIVHISTAGRAALAAEQHAERQRVEIRIWTVAAALIAIAGLIGFKLLGM
ncbi:hypothetical protein [Burkholderia ubonensis]|uniref:hypothetical protein n=1 Tax=Burkholderia ubonensis TaxID=101571 RepID=UPI0007521A20|nr:hypothetical protein [Burkholderia ubonensis]KVC83987.1 hypothetical protein WI75_04775 [Burkholderia ubonensis]